MKSTSTIAITPWIALIIMVTTGCKDLLQEQPRSLLTPDYYKTGQGITAGLTSVYSSFKFYYGTEGGMNLSVYGTDEFTHGQQVTNPPLNTYVNLTAAMNDGRGGDLLTPWNRSYSAINTCNGILQLGQEAPDLTAAQKGALIAEAKYLRAQWYFILTTTFGPATLDLGAGPLRFNTNPTNDATRSSLSDVTELPDKPAAPGRVWKATALHLLSKVYLTRGYSSAAQSADFQNAYNTAKQLIDNKGSYGVNLNTDYGTNFKEGNEYNSTGNPETLRTVDWIDNLTFNNTQANGLAGDDGLRQNKSHFLFRMLYVTNTPGMIRDVANGRPFVRYKPTPWLLDVAFADKVNDTRYNKSFQTVWYCNSTTTNNPKGLKIGDTAIFMVPAHLASKFSPLKNSKPYVLFLPNEATSPIAYFGANNTFTAYGGVNLQNQYYPSLSKYNSTQARAGNDPNISSVRPFVVYRLAETYLIAAEAAFQMGNLAEAANQINVVRTRAAASGQVAAMTANTLSDLTAGGIDYILDERSRELCGEQMRWFDLVRTGKLIQRVNLYNSTPATPGTIAANGTITGTPALIPSPQSFHILRPIPQQQLDGAVDESSPGGKYGQNPGY